MNVKQLLIATTNAGKKKELLDGLSLPYIEFLTLNDFLFIKDIEETGTNFEENALIKAKHFGNHSQIPTLSEDSGIIVEAFPKKFGIRTRREFPEECDDTTWLMYFLKLLQNQKNRNATFYSSIAFFDPKTKTSHVVTGSVSGYITESQQAKIEKGVPISSVFIPKGSLKVFSAMTPQEKNSYSHRGRAVFKMMEFLKSQDWT